MKTKIGEIKSIRDFFKNWKLDKSEGLKDIEEYLRPYYEETICKLCGEKIKGLSPQGFLSYNVNFPPYLIDDDLKKHLELHQLVQMLKL